MMNKPTLLAVFAHPDDEAFGTGGTLARYAAEGCNVYLVTATRGEAGEIAPPSLATPANLPASTPRSNGAPARCSDVGARTPERRPPRWRQQAGRSVRRRSKTASGTSTGRILRLAAATGGGV